MCVRSPPHPHPLHHGGGSHISLCPHHLHPQYHTSHLCLIPVGQSVDPSCYTASQCPSSSWTAPPSLFPDPEYNPTWDGRPLCPPGDVPQDSLLQVFQTSPEVSEQGSDSLGFIICFSLYFPPAFLQTLDSFLSVSSLSVISFCRTFLSFFFFISEASSRVSTWCPRCSPSSLQYTQIQVESSVQ
ncbi:unnamed protein product [Staurois parvus]|uniref:Uncharacterized protein n=1 Tax=Staurois parvus TaxID=386267 RepID=A0ABN9BGR5_9NEOB|nr:unnamed protein product [Staurois parvus]